MPIPISELQSPNPSPIIELYELTLNPVLHGTASIQDPDGNNLTTLRFHNNTNEKSTYGHLKFGNVTYYRLPIDASGFEYNPKQLPRPTLTISNLIMIAQNIGNMSAVLNAVNTIENNDPTTGTFANDLVGATFVRRRTLKKFLDSSNFTATNPTADSTQEYAQQIFEVARLSMESRNVVQFELAASVDSLNKKLPARMFLPDEFIGIGGFYN